MLYGYSERIGFLVHDRRWQCIDRPAILLAVGVVWSIPQAWRQALAEDRARRLANQVESRLESHTNDIPPTSDI